MADIFIYILALGYYLFCTIAMVTYMQEDKAYRFLEGLCVVVLCMLIAPIGTPIVLGITLGNKLKEE